MWRCQEIQFCAFMLSLQVISLSFVIICTNHCALAKVVTNFADRENLKDGLRQGETVQNKFYHDLYDYYDDSFQEYQGQRVVDLDQEFEEYGGQQVVDLDQYENELDRKASVLPVEDLEKTDIRDYEKSGHHALTSPAVTFDPRCPDLSDGGQSNHSLCLAKVCQSDEDCFDDQDRSIFTPKRGHACCFNGCVLACLPKIDPPKAFDWIEDTDAEQSQGLSRRPSNPNAGKLKSLAQNYDEEENSSDKIVLPGGCVITPQQMEELQMFRKYDHVELCTCQNGEVVCQVKTRTSSHSSKQNNQN